MLAVLNLTHWFYFDGQQLTGSSPCSFFRPWCPFHVSSPLSASGRDGGRSAECRHSPLNTRNSTTNWLLRLTLWLADWKVSSSCSGHGRERGDVERTGGFKFPFPIASFDLKSRKTQRPAAFFPHTFFRLKLLFVIIRPEKYSNTPSTVFPVFWVFPSAEAAHWVGTDRLSWSRKWRLLSRRNAARSEDSSKLLSETWK